MVLTIPLMSSDLSPQDLLMPDALIDYNTLRALMVPNKSRISPLVGPFYVFFMFSRRAPSKKVSVSGYLWMHVFRIRNCPKIMFRAGILLNE